MQKLRFAVSFKDYLPIPGNISIAYQYKPRAVDDNHGLLPTLMLLHFRDLENQSCGHFQTIVRDDQSSYGFMQHCPIMP